MIDTMLGLKFNNQVKPCFKKYMEGKVKLIKEVATPEVTALIAISSGEMAELERRQDTKKLCDDMLQFK